MPTTFKSNDRYAKVREEMRALEDEIRRHNYFYYLKNSPRITDKEFDQLFQRLKKLEEKYPNLASPDSPTKTVGSDLDLQSDFSKFTHRIPVLSLENTYNISELWEWISKTGVDEIYSVEWKIDGATVVLYYEMGILTNGVTRGTGGIGDDITENIKTIEAIPHQISERRNLIIRGEVFMTYEDFEEFNELYGGRYANPRNLASGSLKHKYASEVARRPLRIFTYDAYFPDGRGEFTTNQKCLEYLNTLGFPVVPDTVFEKGSNIPIAIENFKKQKESLPFPVDGLVIKVNELSKRDLLGETSHSPRWAKAFKFDALTKETTIEDISVQVGRTGKITPRARIKPIELAGTSVTYATLHNQDYIEELGIGIGAKVRVSKRGEIIPAVEEVVEQGPHGIFRIPTHCPGCGTQLKKIDDSVDLFCTNPSCPERIKQGLLFFCHKKQMNIEGLGEKQIEIFFDKGLVTNISDLYRLKEHRDEILKLDGFGEKSVTQLLKSIEQSKLKNLRSILPALGLNEIGHKVTEILIDSGYRSIDSLIELAKQKEAFHLLNEIHGIGPKTAEAIVQQLTNPKILQLLEELKELGLNFNASEVEKSESLIFSNQTWCVTGSFEKFQPRERALEIIVRHGGRKVSTVSSKTTHLLYGEGAGSKLDKARSLGVKLVSEKEFLDILKSSGIEC